ncbi:hypothetical protein PUR71_07445 [Streptomyces sp. SP17BM10]|uniref:hypothetical protein n=1 Tax=Streptomyces sp. SP17BM10 TaxID=3002530 RepID=UPI002E75DB6A|nr:hypothetical protein [Streptomyces sp. SP17BM10]MEE1782752.1 hypothetical protein [Streptomyces sp. SP17BM10]
MTSQPRRRPLHIRPSDGVDEQVPDATGRRRLPAETLQAVTAPPQPITPFVFGARRPLAAPARTAPEEAAP